MDRFIEVPYYNMNEYGKLATIPEMMAVRLSNVQYLDLSDSLPGEVEARVIIEGEMVAIPLALNWEQACKLFGIERFDPEPPKTEAERVGLQLALAQELSSWNNSYKVDDSARGWASASAQMQLQYIEKAKVIIDLLQKAYPGIKI